jgi:hypothetical protein
MDDRSEAGRALQALRPRVTLICSACQREYQGFAYRRRGTDVPRYCSNACKMKARYQHQKAQSDHPPISPTQ